MNDDRMIVTKSPPGTEPAGRDVQPLSPKLVAALAGLGDENYVDLPNDDPDATEIVLDGRFSRAALAALVAAWQPESVCENGHRLGRESQRRACYCGAPLRASS